MGNTGPCGPCSEIFYDHGESIEGGPPGSPDQEGDRYVEIWNLVFMQYDRDAGGTLTPLPKPSVDTGMGLERIAAIMQGVHNNYDIDIFKHLIDAIHDRVRHKTKTVDADDEDSGVSARVIADHIRSCSFLIMDSVIPSNEGRGYVLRRIIRRAIRHGSNLGFDDTFFYQLVKPLAEVMAEAYPELEVSRKFIEQTLQQEELQFSETLQNGLKHLEDAIDSLSDKIIPGEDIFKLYDTYGFPVDLTADVARERGLSIDMPGFEQAMEEQRERARLASKFDMEMLVSGELKKFQTEFKGYEDLYLNSRAVAIFRDGESVAELKEGEEGGVVLKATPFYAESGGQLGDQGELRADGLTFIVSDTQKQGRATIHVGSLSLGNLVVEQQLGAHVDTQTRTSIVRNHSATHLLHAALRQVLGGHVTQKGSMVTPDKLRFNFSHPEQIPQEQLLNIEEIVNNKIMENLATNIDMMNLEKAKQSGAMSLFGEKYEETVRVLSIAGKFSVELCGGTHVSRAGDIGLFKILSESGIAAGVRRIEAVTGEGALSWVSQTDKQLQQIASMLKSERNNIEVKLEQQLKRNRKIEKEIIQLKSKLASSAGENMVSEAEDIGGIKVLTKRLDDIDANAMRETVDQLKNKLVTAALVLASVSGSKVSLIAGVTNDSTDKIKAGELVDFVAQQVGGRGGGRADMAQAGGTEPAALADALKSVPGWIEKQI